MLRRRRRMDRSATAPGVLRTSAGELPLAEYRQRLGGREWRIVHAEAVLSQGDESDFLRERKSRISYGLAL
jgi:hypothetical protein